MAIKIHYREPNGVTGVINHFPGDNAELSGSMTADIERRRTALYNQAQSMAHSWAKVYPDTQFFVVDTGRE